jgi:hypothetical protein
MIRGAMTRAVLALVLACGEPQHTDPVTWPVRERLPTPMATSDAGDATSVELTTAVVDAKPDAATATTIVTIGVGAHHGVTATWIGTILDDAGAVAGRFTILEIKDRSTTGATTLAAKLVTGKRVRLASP